MILKTKHVHHYNHRNHWITQNRHRMQRILVQIRYLERGLSKSFNKLTLKLTFFRTVCHPCVTRMSFVCTRMPSLCTLCHLYVTRMYLNVTRMSSVCHSYVPVSHSYVTRLWYYHEPFDNVMLSIEHYLLIFLIKNKISDGFYPKAL